MEQFDERAKIFHPLCEHCLHQRLLSSCARRLPCMKACCDAYYLVLNMKAIIDQERGDGMVHPSKALKRKLKGKRYLHRY